MRLMIIQILIDHGHFFHHALMKIKSADATEIAIW